MHCIKGSRSGRTACGSHESLVEGGGKGGGRGGESEEIVWNEALSLTVLQQACWWFENQVQDVHQDSPHAPSRSWTLHAHHPFKDLLPLAMIGFAIQHAWAHCSAVAEGNPSLTIPGALRVCWPDYAKDALGWRTLKRRLLGLQHRWRPQ